MSESNILQTALENAKKPFTTPLPNGEVLICSPDENGTWWVQQKNLTGKPLSVRGKKLFNTVDSFLRYLNVFKTEATNIYFDIDEDFEQTNIVAIIDDAQKDKPDNGEFRIKYTPQKTPMAKAWLEGNNEKKAQNDFCSFLEQHASDIVGEKPDDPSVELPSSAAVLDFCSNMVYTEKLTFQSSYNEQDGRIGFSFKNEDGNEKKISAFKKFALAFTPFIGGESFYAEALLKFRFDKNNGGSLTLWYELQQLDLIMAQAIKQIEDEISKGAGETPIYYAKEPDSYI